MAFGVRRRFAPHQLRHAHAIELAREGVPLHVIQRQLGATSGKAPIRSWIMKWTMIPALLGLAAIGAFLSRVGTSESTPEPPMAVTGEVVTTGAASTPALLSNTKRTGALLGVKDYHLPAGENARIRIPLRSGGRDKRVVLNWQQDQSGWSGGYYDLTLRR
jgi:hypothetical protein